MPGGLESRFDIPFDFQFQTKDAGLIASDDVAQVGGADAIVDLGAGQYHGCLLIDASAVEVDNGNELFEIYVQGSTSATFASNIANLAMLPFGDAAVQIGGADKDMGAGFHRLLFSNVRPIAGVDTIFRYARVYVDVTGTIATGINFTAFMGRIDRSL